MLCGTRGRRLTNLAVRLTRIAIRTALHGLLHAPGGGRTAEPVSERAGKRFRRTKTYRQRNIQNCRARLGCDPHDRDLDTPAPQIVAKRLAHPCRENSVEMERPKVRDPFQRIEIERLVKLPINVLDRSMHSILVLRAAFA